MGLELRSIGVEGDAIVKRRRQSETAEEGVRSERLRIAVTVGGGVRLCLVDGPPDLANIARLNRLGPGELGDDLSTSYSVTASAIAPTTWR